MKLAELRYHLSKLHVLWRRLTLRCPACPKRFRGPHKFGCSLHGKRQVVLYMKEK